MSITIPDKYYKKPVKLLYDQLFIFLFIEHKNLRAFISHGGIFGIQEAIYSAVPLIGIPLFGDQQANVDTFARARVLYPLSYSDITADNVERAIRTVLGDASFRRAFRQISLSFPFALCSEMKFILSVSAFVQYVEYSAYFVRLH